MLNKDELQLAKKARLGDQEAFSILYNEYIKKIYDFLYFKTFSKELAEDLTSQVFLKALKSISRFSSDNFSAWIYTIARNTLIDHYRSTKETKSIEDCWDLMSDSDTFKNVSNQIALEKISLIMKDLSSSDRELLLMRLWSNLSFKEIAEITNKKESAVKVSFGRALNRLREKVGPVLLLIILSIICKKMN